MEIIAQGAEAQIIKIDDDMLKKIRLEKPYRLEIIDNKLRKFRNRREFKVLNRLYDNSVSVPKPFDISDGKDLEVSFTFEYVKGDVLKNVMNKKLLFLAFEKIIAMHNLGIVHGDLTTLNMIVCSGEVYLIDFGLSDFSLKYEDRAVDLNLFFVCVKNEHSGLYKYKKELEKRYVSSVESGEKIVSRLHEIEHRGRNK